MWKKILTGCWLLGCIAPAWANPLWQLQAKDLEQEREARPATVDNKPTACKALPAADSTRLGIIQQMLTEGRPHAAIAHLDAARIEAPQSDLLRADGLRQTGRGKEAATLYQKLLSSCVAGNAYQGLGLLATQEGNVREAILQLQAASEALPIDPNIRNDYGYALLLADENEGALHEFLTAIELAPGNRQAAHNLLLLLYRMGEVDRARKFAEQFGIGASDVERLKKQALQPLPDIALLHETGATAIGHPGATETAHLREKEFK